MRVDQMLVFLRAGLDSSAARAILLRTGPGAVRHLAVRTLWAQGLFESGEHATGRRGCPLISIEDEVWIPDSTPGQGTRPSVGDGARGFYQDMMDMPVLRSTTPTPRAAEQLPDFLM